MPVKSYKGTPMAKVLAEIKSEVSGLHKDFKDHADKEEKWQVSMEEWKKKMEHRFNNIELNGDGEKDTIEGALRKIYSLVKPLKIRKEFGRRWAQFRDSMPILHFLFSTKPGKFILTAIGVYFIASILNDVGVLKEQPFPLVWSIIKMIVPKIE
jgi:hypothetical protein